MLKIYNTLTANKEEFRPIEAGKVKLYVCGMTVYDFCHIGHARVLVVFDLLRRWLETLGFEVFYVRNITDIDDKIIKRAAENGESIASLTSRFIAAMHEDCAALNVLPPSLEPRATDNIAAMVDLIKTLEEKGLAYATPSGDVLFAVRKFADYGKLAKKSLDDLRAGERVSVNDEKRDPLDFVLWKAAKAGEPFWESPWGRGRPGWHLECSAMSTQFLGDHLDIHGGGQDLQFPHHENEIAQSEGAHGGKFVNYWMHNGFVRVNNEKMAKSLGNFFTIREVLEKYHPEVLRFFILRAHYRSPLNYSTLHLNDAKNSLDNLYFTMRDIPPTQAWELNWNDEDAQKFKNALNEDLDTSNALALLFGLAEKSRQTKNPQLSAKLKTLANILGLLELNPADYFQSTPNENKIDEKYILEKIEERSAAKKARDFQTADKIRAELLEKGVVLEDKPSGTQWRFQ